MRMFEQTFFIEVLVIEPCTVWLLPFLATTFFGSGLCETS